MKFFNPDGQFILQWNTSLLLCSVIALFLDPLFFYIPVLDATQKCLDVDIKLELIVCVLRSFSDMIFISHIITQFRTAYCNHIHGKIIFRDVAHYMERPYLTSYFIIHVLAALPLPQLAVLVIIPNWDAPASFLIEKLLKLIIFTQFVPRVIRIYLMYKKVKKTSGFLTGIAWAGAAFNLFLYVLASHIVGALWYLFAIESEVRCWDIACQRHNCHSKYLYCGEGRVGDFGFLNISCPLLERNEIKDSINFDFGIYLDALRTRVLETTDFPQKFLYCSWWGFQSLSSLGQGLKASTFYGEIMFAEFIAIIGLILFALLIIYIQKYLQYFSNRGEEEELMSHISLPEPLKDRVRRHKDYTWKMTRGTELDSFVRDLPRDMRRDIKRHVCLPSLMRVPMFKAMDEHVLDAMCERLKPFLFTRKSHLIREQDPVPEMFFITRGVLESYTTPVYSPNDGMPCFLNSTRLKAGDFCGEELFTWALSPATQRIPISTRTVQAVTDVEAFAVVADDLKFVASQFSLLHRSDIQATFRYCSHVWRTWAVCLIQAAWRRRFRRKLFLLLERHEATLSLTPKFCTSNFKKHWL